MMRIISFCFLAALLCSGCSDSDNSWDAAFYGGTWDVRYNTVEDGCQFVGNFPGVVDQHYINQSGSDVLVSAGSRTIVEAVGTLEPDNSFFAERVETKDVFQNGSACQVQSRVRYQDLRDESARTVFEFGIRCPDGWECQSRFLGEATRQPGGEPDVEIEE